MDELYSESIRQSETQKHPLLVWLAKESEVSLYLVQIFVRISIMGLSLKISIQDVKSEKFSRKMWVTNFMEIYNRCQL